VGNSVTAMNTSGWLLIFTCVSLANGGLRPSFWLSRCAWEATDVVELVVTPTPGAFRVVSTIKGGTRHGTIKKLVELAPPVGDHSMLKDLIPTLPFTAAGYTVAPPIRDVDRLIAFLRPDDEPSNWTLLTSAIWLQDGMAYVFEQTMNPGPTHLVTLEKESLVQAEIAPLLRLRQEFDHAVASPNVLARTAQLAQLVTSGDDIVIRSALNKLSGDGPE